MKKQYTKKQICEAISYWKKQLNESFPSSCDGSETGVMCYTHHYAAYNSGDEDWLYVAPNFKKFIDAFVDVANNEYTAVIVYKGKAAKAGTPEFNKLMLAIRQESLDINGAVHVKWIDLEEPYKDINANDYDENDGEDVDINFYDCSMVNGSDWSPDGYHILACS